MASTVEFKNEEGNLVREDSHSFISRCPVDVIMCIFEAVMEIVDNETEAAIILSHVCRRWREVAISMPKLWDYLEIWCSKPIEALQLQVEQIASRVRARPVKISIYDIDKDSEMAGTISELRLDQFLAIKYLVLELRGDDSMHTQILNSQIEIFGHRVEGLEIFFMNQEQHNYHWNSSELLQRFPRVEMLRLVRPATMEFGHHWPFTSIRRLEISKTELDPTRLLRAFPQLESLELHNVELWGEDLSPGQLYLLENLRDLQLKEIVHRDGQLASCLSQIQCPLLSNLYIDNEEFVECLPFISSHQSLRAIRLCPSNYIQDVANIAPDLEYISVLMSDEAENPMIAFSRGKALVFPRLNELMISATWPNTWKLEEFEALVCTRCLPNSHPRCQRPESIAVIRELVISIEKSQLEDCTWTTNPLYEEAKKTFEVNDNDDSICFLTMSWI